MVPRSCNFLLADVEKRRTLFDRKGKFEIFQWRRKSVKWGNAETLVRVDTLCSSGVRGAERRMLATTAGSGGCEQALSTAPTAPDSARQRHRAPQRSGESCLGGSPTPSAGAGAYARPACCICCMLRILQTEYIILHIIYCVCRVYYVYCV